MPDSVTDRTTEAARADSPPGHFGPWTLTFLVVASMIGAGVFTTSGYALADLGSPSRVMAAWFAGGMIALAGAWSYAQLALAIPESGGEYLFLSRAAHPMLGFIAGWVSLLAGFTGAIAFAATALETYVVPANHRPAWLPEDALAIGVVFAAALAHGARPRGGALLQNIAVALKIGLLLGFLLLAAARWPDRAPYAEALPTGPSGGWGLAAAFATSLVWISLSYSGFNAAVYVAGEARDPRRNVPRSLLLGTWLVGALYLLLNAVFVYGPPMHDVAGAPDVAAVAAEWLGGSQVALFARAIISLALLTSVSSMIMSAPRVYAKMADDGLLPRALRSRGSAPRFAVAAQAVLASVFILFASLRQLLSYLGLTLSLCAACSVACLFLPSFRAEGSLAAIPRSRLPAAIYIVATLTTAGIMTLNDPAQLLATALTFSLGAIVYWIARRTQVASTRNSSGPEHGDC